MKCKDPDWMKTSLVSGQGTFYPAGTECYRDPTTSSCFLFGNSGSGVLRKFTSDKYAFTGPLSMSKSCDKIWIMDKQISYSAENPGVFTDAYCYLPWIASAYGMKLPSDYQVKSSCSQTQGSRENIEQEICWGHDAENQDRGRCLNWENESYCVYEELTPNNLTCVPTPFTDEDDCVDNKPFYNGLKIGTHYNKCDFTYNYTYEEDGKKKSEIWNKCKLFAQEGYAYNIYMCKVVFLKGLSFTIQIPIPRTLRGTT